MPLNQPGRSGGVLPYLFLYIPVVWAALLIAQSLGNGLPELLTNLTAALQTPLKIRWTEHSLMSILACTGAYIIGICLYCTTQGRTRDGEEHGSAQWASPKQVNAMFCQKQNKPLTQNVRLGLDTHKHRRSLNVLVIGGSGAAKTRSYVLPNILEANTNYVITDPKMEVLTATGGYLKNQGYDVRVLNLVNMEQSDGYNPFRYIRDEKDALRLVNNLIQATTPKMSRIHSGPRRKRRCCRPSFSCCSRRRRSPSRIFPWSCGCWSTLKSRRTTRTTSRRWICCSAP